MELRCIEPRSRVQGALPNGLAQGAPERSGRAFVRLALWGLIALPIYYGLVGRLVIRADILITLAAGVGLVWLIQRRLWLPAAGAAVAVAAAGPWLDGGALSALAVPVGYLLARHRPAFAPWGVAVMAAAANLWGSPHLLQAAALVLVAPLILMAAGRLGRWAPRGPGILFYVYYPAHLLLILVVLGPYG